MKREQFWSELKLYARTAATLPLALVGGVCLLCGTIMKAAGYLLMLDPRESWNIMDKELY